MKNCNGKMCLALRRDYATQVALAPLGDTTQIKLFLFVSYCLIWPSQIGVIKMSAIYAMIMP